MMTQPTAAAATPNHTPKQSNWFLWWYVKYAVIPAVFAAISLAMILWMIYMSVTGDVGWLKRLVQRDAPLPAVVAPAPDPIQSQLTALSVKLQQLQTDVRDVKDKLDQPAQAR